VDTTGPWESTPFLIKLSFLVGCQTLHKTTDRSSVRMSSSSVTTAQLIRVIMVIWGGIGSGERERLEVKKIIDISTFYDKGFNTTLKQQTCFVLYGLFRIVHKKSHQTPAKVLFKNFRNW
jgi:hypothetical protein